jgi:maltooligosyltrehalose trehalohydrolase
MTIRKRRFSAGVELLGDSTADVRVWAPACRSVEFVHETRTIPLTRDDHGFFSGIVDGAKAGDHYWFLLDGTRRRPDPVSRYQPEGPHGPSEIVDGSSFRWSDQAWSGLTREGQVIYELHVGTFTPEGTWASAMARLEEVASVGVTVIQMMPVADFAGRWGWGYDGVNLYAPTRLYGRPDDLRRFVDHAHRLGLGVILDVVYNHLGPDGNYLWDFSKDYFTARYTNDWGSAINFEGPRPARDTTSTALGSMRRMKFEMRPTSTCSPSKPRERDARPAVRSCTSSPRTTCSTAVWCGSRKPAVTDSTRSSTTITTMPRSSP